MNAADFRFQLEQDLSWRQEELRLLRNQISHLKRTRDKKIYCKSLVVMLYAHFEGFCKTAFLTYVDVINTEGLDISKVNEYIAAASLEDVILAVGNPEKKCNFFSDSWQKDLKKFHRHVCFIQELDNLLNRQVRISHALIEEESNLRPRVLQRILYRLGLPRENFDAHEGPIHNLIQLRNDFSHGHYVSGVDEDRYNILESNIYDIMSELMITLTQAVADGSYLKVRRSDGISACTSE